MKCFLLLVACIVMALFALTSLVLAVVQCKQGHFMEACVTLFVGANFCLYSWCFFRLRKQNRNENRLV
jgi:hypothetical protein